MVEPKAPKLELHSGQRVASSRPAARRRLAWALALACAFSTPAGARNVALLIGVGNYGNADWNLEGPVNDVRALRDVLQRRWGFAPADMRVLTDQQATRDGILAELKALQTRSAPGDDVFIYLSGHGTSALDGTLAVPLPHGSGAFVPFGIKPTGSTLGPEQLVVGRTDLLPLLKVLDEGGRRVWVVSDSCYSGNQTRSILSAEGVSLQARAIPLLVSETDKLRREANEARAEGRTATPPYPYRNVGFLAASAEGELAKDIRRTDLRQFPTRTNQPHGAMTDALLRVLEGDIPADFNADGSLDLNEVHRAVGDFMAQRAYGHAPVRLPPVIEDSQGLGSRAVLAAKGVAARPMQQEVQPLRLRIGPGLPVDLPAALKGMPGLVVAEGGAADVVVRGFQGRWQLGIAAGDLLATLEPGPSTALQEQLQQLAWAHRFRQLGQRHQRGVLPMDIHPAEFGGNLRIGQQIHFSVRPDKDAWLVLLNIDARGRVSVLYPNTKLELGPLQGGRSHPIPGSEPSKLIQVQPPVGMDMQFALAFDSPPQGLESLLGVVEASPADRRLLGLEAWLSRASGRFTFAHSHLRVSEARR